MNSPFKPPLPTPGLAPGRPANPEIVALLEQMLAAARKGNLMWLGLVSIADVGDSLAIGVEVRLGAQRLPEAVLKDAVAVACGQLQRQALNLDALFPAQQQRQLGLPVTRPLSS